MMKVNGYLLSNRVAEMLQQVEFIPTYVQKQFDQLFSKDAVLASWIQYYTYPDTRKKDTTTEYVEYMFRKCCEYDKKSNLRLVSVYMEEGNWNVNIEEEIF